MFSPDLEPKPKAELLAQGWERRFVADPVRTKEVVQLYREMGYDVHLEPVILADLSEDCRSCSLATNFFVTVYVRKLRS